METASKVAFYAALSLGTPIILLSYRCMFILTRKEYLKHAFCRIFICSLISNSFAFVLLMHNLRFPGMGFFSSYYEAIKDGWWLAIQSYLARIFYVLSLMLSFMLSLNRVTSLYLEDRIAEKLWRHFFILHLPMLIIFTGLLSIDVVLNRAEYVQGRDSAGGIKYSFVNYNLTLNFDSYWLIVECVLDLICNALIILKCAVCYSPLAHGPDEADAVRELPLSHQLLQLHRAHSDHEHADLSPLQRLPALVAEPRLSHLERIFDAAILLPTVAILALTKEIRTEVRRALFSCGRFVSTNVEKLGTSWSR
ncbi:hypothetical protein PRIPAC_90967 [Pristionchus pacificus]|uniref:Uncharacterized protein n=1 Tax=Pristionchus pacificus TaxID=54126 RepID=A0A2A6B7R5_PRIPA|nr:hypothetical protein PRIPAC_90967 [Pristionchus pacificus]|eukprot:PDM61915.1 hypothetical protein PRIPAC_51357 [Pristionchus pacificus]